MVDINILTWAIGIITGFGVVAIGLLNRRIEISDARIITLQGELDRVATLEAHRLDSDRRTAALEANITQISAQFASMQTSIAKQEVMLNLLLNQANNQSNIKKV